MLPKSLGILSENKVGVKMHKHIGIILISFIFMFTAQVNAEGTKKEGILEDAVTELLTPQIYSAVKDYYGDSKGIGFMCLKVTNIKKDQPGSYHFDVEVEGVTFKDAHTPLDIFNMRIKYNDATEGKWVLENYKARKYNSSYVCREPA